MSKDTKWLIGVAMTLAIPLISVTAWIAIGLAAVPELKASVDELNKTVQGLIQDDIADIKARMLVMEQKDILPRAEVELHRLEERVRMLEAGK